MKSLVKILIACLVITSSAFATAGDWSSDRHGRMRTDDINGSLTYARIDDDYGVVRLFRINFTCSKYERVAYFDGMWKINGKRFPFNNQCVGNGVMAFYPNEQKGIDHLKNEFFNKKAVNVENRSAKYKFSAIGFTKAFSW